MLVPSDPTIHVYTPHIVPPFVLKPECPCIQAAYRCLVDVWVQRNLFEPDLALVQPGDQPVSIDSLGMVVG